MTAPPRLTLTPALLCMGCRLCARRCSLGLYSGVVPAVAALKAIYVVRVEHAVCCVQCPLFARKFGNDTETVDAVLDALHECSEHGSNILGACKV